MADVVLAECGGQAWLVGGEQYIDDLLANTLSPDVSIEVVACESKLAVNALWRANGGEDVASMWLIHPAIVSRAKGVVVGGVPGLQFAAWSASLDKLAEAVLQTAADALARDAALVLVLVRHAKAEAPAMEAELGSLRCGLVEAGLGGLGVAAGRISREVRGVDGPGQADRIDVVVRRA